MTGFPDDLFDEFTDSAFRLEGLPQYIVGEDERIRAWREGRPQERSPRTSPWLKRIEETTARGKRWHRVHVVDIPLSEYVRFEIDGYRGNVDAGEDVRLADRAASRRLRELSPDFWLLDGDTDHAKVVWMDYAEDGTYRGYTISTDPGDIARCRRDRDVAISFSVPLSDIGDILAA